VAHLHHDQRERLAILFVLTSFGFERPGDLDAQNVLRIISNNRLIITEDVKPPC
jgi:hypothetical protein